MKLLTSIILLITQAAIAQGTFTYTFSGDISPLNVSAIFSASQQAVSSGLLTADNIFADFMVQGGQGVPFYYVNMPVDTSTGQLNGDAGYTQVTAFFGYDEIDIYGGLLSDPHTDIVFWPWNGEPADWPNFLGKGKWNVAYSVPEPNTASLLVIGAALLRLAKPLA